MTAPTETTNARSLVGAQPEQRASRGGRKARTGSAAGGSSAAPGRHGGERRALWYLKKIPFFEGFGQQKLAGLLDILEICELRRRQVVYLPGDPGESVYFINGGRVKISKVTRDGREITLAYLGPGDVFGELCLFNGRPRKEMAETMDNCLVTVVGRESLENLLTDNPDAMLRLFKVVLSRRLEVENKVEYLVFRDVSAKLAELLLRLGEQYGVEDPRGILLGVKITHQEMANLIGSTRETVSLTLSQFKSKALIQVDRRKIILKDVDALKGLI